ncbi:CAP domain-containing protein [Pelagibacterium montanilacus]|uniref:CAP domain-containing protein n=1 Tax=Pelagibacterium montanilacus TaxID=2185280 RepID=UPI000F8EE3AF|nr:CAP domain-containing protein [Pelagibacterium montanilacus]
MTLGLANISARGARAGLTIAALGLVAVLAGCLGPAAAPSGGLAPGLVTPISSEGAQMDRGAALGLINQYRSVRGVSALSADTTLNAQAQAVAAQYAATGTAPSRPSGASVMQLSAGYENFAETFSGWRNNRTDADALATSGASKAGLAVVYAPNSSYGTHWVLLMAP